MRKVYRGSDIEVSFDLDVCVHIGECLRGHPGVFKLDRRPWILPDEADADTVGEVVRRCPSGALQYRRLDGGPQEEHSGKAITPIRDGPLLGPHPRPHEACFVGWIGARSPVGLFGRTSSCGRDPSPPR